MTTPAALTPRTLAPIANTRTITDTVNQLVRKVGGTAGIINVKDFGAIGDGSKDDLAAFNAAIAAASGKQIFIPPGTYKLSNKLTITDISIVLLGAGSDLSLLSFSGTTGGIDWSVTSASDALQVIGLGLVAAGTVSTPALSASITATLGAVSITCRVSDVLVSPGAGSWANGIYFNNCRNAVITDSNVIGTYGTTGYGIKLAGNSTDVRIARCEAANLTNAIYKTDTCEGLSVHHYLAINVDTGILTDHSSGEPGLYVTDSHFNVNVKCFDLTNVMQAFISNCLLYGYTGGAMAGLVHLALAGSDSADIIVSNTIFHGTGYTGSKTAISLSTGARISVHSSVFIGVTTAISAGASSSNCFFGNNKYSTVTTQISDSGTNNHSVNLASTSLLTATLPADALYRVAGATSASLQLTDLGGAADTKTIGWFSDAQTMLARLWKDDGTQLTDLGRFAVGRISIGGTLNSEAFSTNTGVFANRLTVTGTAAAASPSLSAAGSDTDINITLTPKGAGNVQFGTHTAKGAEAFTGFITILDAGGTSRKVMVCS